MTDQPDPEALRAAERILSESVDIRDGANPYARIITEEYAPLRAERNLAAKESGDWAAVARELRAENERLRTQARELADYAEHRPNCRVLGVPYSPHIKCNCGWSELMDRYRAIQREGAAPAEPDPTRCPVCQRAPDAPEGNDG